MLQFSVIALIGLLALHDAMPGVLSSSPASAISPLLVIAFLVVANVVLCGTCTIVCNAASKSLDRDGRYEHVLLAQRMTTAARTGSVLVHGVLVFVMGWPELVRRVMGEFFALDELIIIFPALLVITWTSWAIFPIHRRLREAMILRTLDQGMPLYPIPSRLKFVWSNVRHQTLMTLVPIFALGAWNRLVDAGFAQAATHAQRGSNGSVVNTILGRVGEFIHEHAAFVSWARLGMHLVSLFAMVALGPMLVRLLWETVPIAPGEIRTRLMSLSKRSGVGSPELRVWQTHGMAVNALAIGVLPRLRSVVISDTILDQLPPDQVDGVMAHELGHMRHRHILWLLLALLASMSACLAVADLAIHFVGDTFITQASAGLAAIAAGFAVFGFVSRRFEWQADAFAAAMCSQPSVIDARTLSEAQGPIEPRVNRAGALAIIGALESVCAFSGVPQDKWTFRHGSIRSRQRKVAAIINRPIDRLPIDRQVRLVKCAIVVALAGVVALSVWGDDQRDASGGVSAQTTSEAAP